MSETWTQERVARLTGLWNQGFSCAQIAGMMGDATRNAVIGKIHRLGLNEPAFKRAPKEPREKKPKQPRGDRKRQGDHHSIYKIVNGGGGTYRVIQATESAETIKLRCVEIVPRHLALVDLEPTDCRYPYGGDRDGEPITFCGHGPLYEATLPGRLGYAVTKTSVYCKAHHFLSVGPGMGSERAATRGVAA